MSIGRTFRLGILAFSSELGMTYSLIIGFKGFIALSSYV